MKKRCLALLILAVALVLILRFLRLPPTGDPDEENTEDATERILTLEGRRYAYTGDEEDVAAEDDVLILRRGGVYRITGALKEGALRIDAGADATVRLILAGMSVTSSYHPPLSVVSAACVILEPVAETVNVFTDAARTADEGTGILPLACVEARCHLVIRGEGTLTISGRSACAVACGGTVWIQSGRLTLSAPHTALWARDAIQLRGGSVTVSAARYGLVADDGARSAGTVEITGGRLTAVCSEVAIAAGRSLLVSGGVGDLQAPVPYRCVRQENEQAIEGALRVTATGFPRALAREPSAAE